MKIHKKAILRQAARGHKAFKWGPKLDLLSMIIPPVFPLSRPIFACYFALDPSPDYHWVDKELTTKNIRKWFVIKLCRDKRNLSKLSSRPTLLAWSLYSSMWTHVFLQKKENCCTIIYPKLFVWPVSVASESRQSCHPLTICCHLCLRSEDCPDK